MAFSYWLLFSRISARMEPAWSFLELTFNSTRHSSSLLSRLPCRSCRSASISRAFSCSSCFLRHWLSMRIVVSTFFSYSQVYFAISQKMSASASFSSSAAPPSLLIFSMTCFCNWAAVFMCFRAFSFWLQSCGPCFLMCSLKSWKLASTFCFNRSVGPFSSLKTSLPSSCSARSYRRSWMQSLARSRMRSGRLSFSMLSSQNLVAFSQSWARAQALPRSLMIPSWSFLSWQAFSQAMAASSGQLILTSPSPQILKFSKVGTASMISQQHLAQPLRFLRCVRWMSASNFLLSTKQGDSGLTPFKMLIAFLMSPDSTAIMALARSTCISSGVPANWLMAWVMIDLDSLIFLFLAQHLARSRKMEQRSFSEKVSTLKLSMLGSFTLLLTLGRARAAVIVSSAAAQSSISYSMPPFISMNSEFSRILKFIEMASCSELRAPSNSRRLLLISPCRIEASSFLGSMSNTFAMALAASASPPTASLPLVSRRQAGRNPGICLVMLSRSLIPLPTGPVGAGFSAPSFISFIERPCRYSQAMANRKSGLSLVQQLNPGGRVLEKEICSLRAPSKILWASKRAAVECLAFRRVSTASRQAMMGVLPMVCCMTLTNSIWFSASSKSSCSNLHSIMPAIDSSLDSSRDEASWKARQASSTWPIITSCLPCSIAKSAFKGSAVRHFSTTPRKYSMIRTFRPQTRRKS